MPFWVWLLIDLGIGLLGVVVLALISRELFFKFNKMQQESAILQASLLDLQQDLETASGYLKPENNLGDNPVALTGLWLARKRRHEQEKSTKQRRLIARFSKRK